MSKITMATIKSFVNKNRANLLISNLSSFNGMSDCVEHSEDNKFYPIRGEEHCKNTLGIVGAWFVTRSNDLLKKYEDNYFTGYEVYNCCGSFILAIRK